MAVVVQIDAYDPVAGAAVTLRFASHDDPAVCHLNGLVWWPAIGKLPTLQYDLFDGGFANEISVPSSSMTVSIEPWPLFARFAFADARFQLWTGNVGDAWALWTQRFDGRVSDQPEIKAGIATVNFSVDDSWLDTPLLALYAGTTGIEGAAAQLGTPKPLALGAPRYVPGVMIDAINTIVQVNGYGSISSVDAAMDKLSRFGGVVTDYASFAALQAATIAPGRYATCKAFGLIRHGAPPAGQLSYLIGGDNSGTGGWVRLPGAIIRRIAEIAGASSKVSVASLAALDTARPWPISIWLSDQTTARDIIQRIAASVNAVAGVSWLGKLFVVPIGIGTPTMTLRTDGSALPPVGDLSQVVAGQPFWRMALQSERTWQVHALGDVAFSANIVEQGVYNESTSYREGNVVSLADGSRYLFTFATPTIGATPPNATYWTQLSGAVLVSYANIGGAGKPEKYATGSDNTIFNASLGIDATSWQLSAGVFREAIAGYPLAAWFQFGVGSNLNAIANDNTRIAINGATMLYVSSYRYVSGAGSFAATIDFYDGAGAYVSSYNLDLYTGAPAGFTRVSGKAPVPSNAVSYVAHYTGNFTSGLGNAGALRVARTQDAADVTALNTAADTAAVAGKPSATLLAEVTAAKSQADAGEAHAQEALISLNNQASDGVLSRKEKPVAYGEGVALNAEYPGISTQASAYGVISELANYTTAVQAMNNYLASISPSYTDYTTNSNINRTNFINAFNNVYSTKQIVLNLIAQVAGTRAQWYGVSGSGKPDSFATNSDNQIKNSTLDVGTEGWVVGAGWFRQANFPGQPLLAWFQAAPTGGSTNCIANDNNLMACSGGSYLYMSAYTYLGGTGTVSMNVNFYKADGSYQGSTASLDLVAGSASYFQQRRLKAYVPADAAFYIAYFAANMASGFINVGYMRIAPTEVGSDVTANAAVIRQGSIAPYVPGDTFTYTADTTSCNITWPNFVVNRADGTSLTVAGGSFSTTSMASGFSYFYPYIVDAGGPGPFSVLFTNVGQSSNGAANRTAAQRTAALTISIQRGNTGFGSISVVIPTTGSSGGGGGGSSCAYVESYMPHGGRAGDVVEGDPLFVLAPDDEGFVEYQVRAVRKDFAPCCRLTAANGVTKVVSESTPITTRGGVITTVADCLGVEVPTLDHGAFSWQKIVAVDDVGIREVVMISASNGTYAAGEQPYRFMFTHNPLSKL